MVEQRFDPQQGSIFTRVDVQTPEDGTFGCNYVRRPEDQPVCGTVNPTAAVQLPR